jgi:GT2 family glycosyltransferase
VRGLQHGLKLGFTPDAVVMHHQGTTTGSGGAVRARSRFAVYLGARNTVLITRDLYPWRAPVATLAAVGMAAMVYLRRGAFKQFGWALSGIAAALRNERDQPGWMR